MTMTMFLSTSLRRRWGGVCEDESVGTCGIRVTAFGVFLGRSDFEVQAFWGSWLVGMLALRDSADFQDISGVGSGTLWH